MDEQKSKESVEDEEIIVPANEIPDRLTCPIHLGIFRDPVICACGHTFCEFCVQSLIKQNSKCPFDKTEFNNHDIIVSPDAALIKELDEILIHCKYGVTKDSLGHYKVNKDACKELIKLRQRHAHERSCMFKPKTVQKLQCIWKDFGCEWQGEYLEAHLLACDLERLKNHLLQGKEDQSPSSSEEVNKLIAQTADYISKGVDNVSQSLINKWQNQGRPKLNEFITAVQNSYNTYSQSILDSESVKKTKQTWDSLQKGKYEENELLVSIMNWSKNVRNQAITSYEDAKIAISEYFKDPVTETNEEKTMRLATKASLESYIEQIESNKSNNKDDILVLPPVQDDISSKPEKSGYSDLSITEDDFYLIIKHDDD